MTKEQIKEAREAIDKLSNFLIEMSKLIDYAEKLSDSIDTKEVFLSQVKQKKEIDDVLKTICLDDILKRFCLDDTSKGYIYLKKAIDILETEGTEKYRCNIIKLLSNITENNTSSETTVRVAIKKGFKKVDKSDPLVSELFGDVFLAGKEYPSVRKFLIRVADFIIAAKRDRE